MALRCGSAPMPKPRLSAYALCCAAVAAGAAAWPVQAVVREDNVGFTAVNRNPWVAGAAFSSEWLFDDIAASLSVPVPSINLSPGAALANFLGLPEIGFARLGGTLAGDFGLDLGYFVSGGRLNLNYPGTGRLDITTRPGDVVPTFLSTPTQTSFTPGLYREFRPLQVESMVLNGGAGYDPNNSIPGFGLARFQEPTFQTAFPNAAAWATLHWNASASLQAQAGVARYRNPLNGDINCVLCVSKGFEVRNADNVTLIDVNRNGVEVIGLGRQALFNQDIALGLGSVRVSYPDVAVGGTRVGGGTGLAGSDSKPIIAFNGDLEKLVPVLGAFLRQSAGPFEVKLLGVSGGPKLSLYQDFTINVTPKVELNFSRPVEWIRAGGNQVTQSITVALGEGLQWRPIAGTGKLLVQPRYILDGEVTNRTGFALGYQIDADALEVDSGVGSLGPLDIAEFNANAAIRLPAFYDHSFSLGLAAVKAPAIELTVRSPVLNTPGDTDLSLQSWARLSGDGDGPGNFRLRFAAGNNTFEAQVFGQLLRIAGTVDGDQLLFEAAQVMRFDVGNGAVAEVGSLLCLECDDLSALMQGSDPFFVDAGETLYFNPLFDFPRDEVDGSVPRLNGATTPLDALTRPLTVLGETVAVLDHEWAPITPVPEPPAWALFVGAGLLFWLRRLGRLGPLGQGAHQR